jgi:hypothetical protein
MREILLRGQLVSIEGNVVYLTINKPLGNKFSINDKLYNYLKRDKEIMVSIGKDKIKLNKDSKILFKEEVKSKFEGSPSWFRYWFNFTPINNKQLQLF